jgi:molybdopterin adenylyltransferase
MKATTSTISRTAITWRMMSMSPTTSNPSGTEPLAQDPVAQAPALLVIGLVSVSDRASGGVYEDKGIPALTEWLASALTSPYRIEARLIADEQALIEQTLIALVDQQRCHLVLTTGGTGPARRDVTPEATRAVGTKEMPGFGEQMRQISLRFVPTAILSRQLAVIRETPDHAALILNLPGQPKSIKETLGGLRGADGASVVDGVFAAVPYCVDLIGGPYIDTNPAVCKAFRPKSALRPQS